jgi:catechol 2,3-dioxygenase-like lactoylglutathione lyase family enzyme
VSTPKSPLIDMVLEVVVIPVSDVDRAVRFYGGLGWRLDADITRRCKHLPALRDSQGSGRR